MKVMKLLRFGFHTKFCFAFREKGSFFNLEKKKENKRPHA